MAERTDRPSILENAGQTISASAMASLVHSLKAQVAFLQDALLEAYKKQDVPKEPRNMQVSDSTGTEFRHLRDITRLQEELESSRTRAQALQMELDRSAFHVEDLLATNTRLQEEIHILKDRPPMAAVRRKSRSSWLSDALEETTLHSVDLSSKPFFSQLRRRAARNTHETSPIGDSSHSQDIAALGLATHEQIPPKKTVSTPALVRSKQHPGPPKRPAWRDVAVQSLSESPTSSRLRSGGNDCTYAASSHACFGEACKSPSKVLVSPGRCGQEVTKTLSEPTISPCGRSSANSIGDRQGITKPPLDSVTPLFLPTRHHDCGDAANRQANFEKACGASPRAAASPLGHCSHSTSMIGRQRASTAPSESATSPVALSPANSLVGRQGISKPPLDSRTPFAFPTIDTDCVNAATRGLHFEEACGGSPKASASSFTRSNSNAVIARQGIAKHPGHSSPSPASCHAMTRPVEDPTALAIFQAQRSDFQNFANGQVDITTKRRDSASISPVSTRSSPMHRVNSMGGDSVDGGHSLPSQKIVARMHRSNSWQIGTASTGKNSTNRLRSPAGRRRADPMVVAELRRSGALLNDALRGNFQHEDCDAADKGILARARERQRKRFEELSKQVAALKVDLCVNLPLRIASSWVLQDSAGDV